MFSTRFFFVPIIIFLQASNASANTQSVCSSGTGFEYLRDAVYGCDGTLNGGRVGLANSCMTGYVPCSADNLKDLQFTMDMCRETPRGKFYAASVSGKLNSYDCSVDQGSNLWGCTHPLPRSSSCFPNEGWVGIDSGIKCGNVLNGAIRALHNPRNDTCHGWSAERGMQEGLTTRLDDINGGGTLCCATTVRQFITIPPQGSASQSSAGVSPHWKIDLFWASVVIFWTSCGFCCAGMTFALFGARVKYRQTNRLLGNTLTPTPALAPARESLSSEVSQVGQVIEETVLHSIVDLDQTGTPLDDGAHVITVRGPVFDLSSFLSEIDPTMVKHYASLSGGGFDSSESLKLLSEEDAGFLEISSEDMKKIIAHARNL